MKKIPLIVAPAVLLASMLSGCVVAPVPEPVVYAPPPPAVVVRPAPVYYYHHHYYGPRWRRPWRY